METNFSTIQSLFLENKLQLTPEQFDAFTTYGEFLVEYNKKVNLTAITDTEQIWKKHFLDSIYPLRYFDLPMGASVIDVGTGAGFPSVPMAIYRRDLNITMLDSLKKRILFLELLAEKTGLMHWSCIHGRAEDVGNIPDFREQYDIAVARAVASLPVLCEYCMPFVKVGGCFLALKGPNESAVDAKYAISVLGGILESEIAYHLGEDERKLIIIRKISQTPTNYPRKSNRIQQKPLCK
ncbi:MAG: 16S rRNA (guanine(527)-N(7))-methyltransferase RsmG [Ruminococcus sp.]|nr:16S rRNA (guanine(527)-N(7))-methyltransferase RsmG [Ruminococcus sp.]